LSGRPEEQYFVFGGVETFVSFNVGIGSEAQGSTLFKNAVW
jgi:hypothetical protein